MAEEKKIIVSGQFSNDALFRYLLVGQVFTHQEKGKSRYKAIELVAGQEHATLAGMLRKVSPRSLYRWLEAYEQAGLSGLEDAKRTRAKPSRVIPQHLIAFAAEQKQLDPMVSLPEVLSRARELGLIKPHEHIDRTSFYRALKRAGVPVARRKALVCQRDTRRFAYPHRMQMILCDGKHFRAGATRARRVALFFLDDASRYGLDCIVGTSENALLFLLGLSAVVRKYGYFLTIYLDKGPGFDAHDTLKVVANLGGLVILGETAYPQGHGKIEKFNQTAKHSLLRGLDRRPDVDPDCEALTLRLRHWLKKRYNHTPHESLGNITPHERFHGDKRPLKFPESFEALDKCFELHERRRVSGDHVIKVNSTAYEMPRGYQGAWVTVQRKVLAGTLHFFHQGRLIQLHPVDLHANAYARRGYASDPQPSDHPLPPSAADLHFQRDFSPIVDPDGGFTDKARNKKGVKND